MAIKYFISARKDGKKKRLYMGRNGKPTVWRILKKRGFFLISEFPMLRKWEQRTGATLKIEATSGDPEYPTKTHYSRNFKREELDCKCGCETPSAIQANLADMADEMLEPLRGELGVGIPILSGYRCPEYNRKVGGATRSQHMNGVAVDFNMPALNSLGVSKDKLLRELKKIKAVNGIGDYPGNAVHGDTRNPPRVTWSSF